MTDRDNIDIEQISSYLRYLPAPLQDGRFIGRFLRAFEAILSGGVVTVEKTGDAKSFDRAAKELQERDVTERWQGLSETLDGITRYFKPQETPADLLPWLARWVAVDLREDWSEATRRSVVASIVPLYTLRGTCRGIEQAVRLCVRETADVSIDDRVEDSESKPYPYYFQVTLTIDARQGPATIQQLYRRAEAAIELQKPAHTYYSVVLKYPSLLLLDDDRDTPPKILAPEGIYVGRNTTLGNVDVDPETGDPLPQQHPSSSDR